MGQGHEKGHEDEVLVHPHKINIHNTEDPKMPGKDDYGKIYDK